MKRIAWMIAIAILVFGTSTSNAQVLVDNAFVFLIDNSGSIDNDEFSLQIDGYVNAFQNPGVVNGFTNGPNGQSAVLAVAFSGSSQQVPLAGWSIIDNQGAANSFANQLDGVSRPPAGLTAPGSAIQFAADELANLVMNEGILASHNAIDISSDGVENNGLDTSDARDAALAGSVDVINAITIGSSSFLFDFYLNNAIGGTNNNGDPAFVLQANNFSDFESAILDKLLLETGGIEGEIPEPTSLAVFGLVTLTSGVYYRRRRRTAGA